MQAYMQLEYFLFINNHQIISVPNSAVYIILYIIQLFFIFLLLRKNIVRLKDQQRAEARWIILKAYRTTAPAGNRFWYSISSKRYNPHRNPSTAGIKRLHCGKYKLYINYTSFQIFIKFSNQLLNLYVIVYNSIQSINMYQIKQMITKIKTVYRKNIFQGCFLSSDEHPSP